MNKKLIISVFIALLISCDTKREKAIDQKDIQVQSLEELRITRNEIFAKHGYIFKSEDLANHFSTKDWYEPKYDDVNHLSQIFMFIFCPNQASLSQSISS